MQKLNKEKTLQVQLRFEPINVVKQEMTKASSQYPAECLPEITRNTSKVGLIEK